MSRALAWVRKSKGSDDDIGLAEQRDEVFALADRVADDVERLDLGVQTGFSSMTRDGDGLLDQSPEVQAAVDDLRRGEYEYLVAWDDRRVCRDEFFEVIKYAMHKGGAEFVYVGDVADDELTHDLKRRIERDTKEEEIRKARQAIRRKKQNGEPLGRAPFGLRHDGNAGLEPHPDEWKTVVDVLELLERGWTYREIEAKTDVSKSGVGNINDRGREFYQQYGELEA